MSKRIRNGVEKIIRARKSQAKVRLPRTKKPPGGGVKENGTDFTLYATAILDRRQDEIV
jgi:hypothetical protein